MKQVALLPLKANSERVPQKNFRHFGGKPLFQWILDSLLAIESISRVVINTDARDRLYACGLSETERVQIRDRPEELRGDLISMNRIIEDDIAAVTADLYLMTHTTNPLLSSRTIRGAINTFLAEQDKYDSLFTVNRRQSRFYREDGTPINHDPNSLIRTQDLEPWFEENSCLYIFSRDSFSKTQARIGKRPLMYETPKLESVDIDDRDDWVAAEALLLYGMKAQS